MSSFHLWRQSDLVSLSCAAMLTDSLLVLVGGGGCISWSSHVVMQMWKWGLQLLSAAIKLCFFSPGEISGDGSGSSSTFPVALRAPTAGSSKCDKTDTSATNAVTQRCVVLSVAKLDIISCSSGSRILFYLLLIYEPSGCGHSVPTPPQLGVGV